MDTSLVLSVVLFLPAADPAKFDKKSPELAKVAELHGVAIHFGRPLVYFLTDYLTECATESEKREFRFVEGQMKKVRELLATAEDDNDTVLDRLAKVLTPVQLRRFREVFCQRDGLMALRFETFARPLNVTDVQKKAILALVEKYHDESCQFHRAMFVSRTKAEASFAGRQVIALSWELDAEILKVLSDKQRKAWMDLLGNPVDREIVMSVALSPDGSKIAFSGTATGYGNFIGLMNADGRGRRRILDDGEGVCCPRFSPDGKTILYSTTKGGSPGLDVMKADGTDAKRIPLGWHEASHGGCYSPDQTSIAFGTEKGCAILDVRSGKVRVLANTWVRPVFSPNADAIVYQLSVESDRDGSMHPEDLFLIKRDGTGDRPLGVAGYNAEFSKDGRVFCLAGDDGQQDVWSIRVDGTDKRQLTTTGGIKRSLSVASQAEKLIFLHGNEIRRLDLYDMKLDGSGLTRISTK